jgi:hypothetical protein
VLPETERHCCLGPNPWLTELDLATKGPGLRGDRLRLATLISGRESADGRAVQREQNVLKSDQSHAAWTRLGPVAGGHLERSSNRMDGVDAVDTSVLARVVVVQSSKPGATSKRTWTRRKCYHISDSVELSEPCCSSISYRAFAADAVQVFDCSSACCRHRPVSPLFRSFFFCSFALCPSGFLLHLGRSTT